MKNMVKIIGRKESVRDSNRVYLTTSEGDFSFPKQIDALETAVKIIPEDYALIQEGNEANCAISMNQGYNGHNQKDTIVRVLKTGLSVPRASKFVRQLLNVGDAVEGKGVLYDASGKLIEESRLGQYANTLFHNCWVWSAESLRKGEGFLDSEVVTITGLDKHGNPIYQAEPLERCLEQDCYADLDSMNSQGFLTRKSLTQKYIPGKNTFFRHPRADSAVGFNASSGNALFNGYWGPLYADARLGVFTCAEGAQKNSGDK